MMCLKEHLKMKNQPIIKRGDLGLYIYKRNHKCITVPLIKWIVKKSDQKIVEEKEASLALLSNDP